MQNKTETELEYIQDELQETGLQLPSPDHSFGPMDVVVTQFYLAQTHPIPVVIPGVAKRERSQYYSVLAHAFLSRPLPCAK